VEQRLKGFLLEYKNLRVKAVNGTHPYVCVSAGRHRNFFDIAGVTLTVGDSPPDPTLNSVGQVIMGFAGSAAGICLSTVCQATADVPNP
jgi:hypothetical protein